MEPAPKKKSQQSNSAGEKRKRNGDVEPPSTSISADSSCRDGPSSSSSPHNHPTKKPNTKKQQPAEKNKSNEQPSITDSVYSNVYPILQGYLLNSGSGSGSGSSSEQSKKSSKTMIKNPCQLCGSTDYKKNGKVKVKAAHGQTIQLQKYACKQCGKSFREPPPPPSSVLRTGTGLSFEKKRRLQMELRGVYGELIVEREMSSDRLEFERTMRNLLRQIRWKRRNISKLLGIPLEDDDEEEVVDENESETTNNSLDHRTIMATATTATATNNNNNTSIDPTTKGNASSPSQEATNNQNPFGEAILLLRKETPKLEQAVNRLLKHPIQLSASSSSSIHNLQAQGKGATDAQEQILRKNEEEQQRSHTVDIVNDDSPLQLLESKKKKHDEDKSFYYKIASRVIQEDYEGEEEIEIYEKCSN